MKTFSDDIITPGKQMEAIKVAFEAQNVFFVQQIKAQVRPLLVTTVILGVLNLITLSVFLYSQFV